MKIVIINQHAGNHGDEAAGKGLLRGLAKRIDFNSNDISIIYNKNTVSELEEIGVGKVKNIPGSILTKFEKIVAMLTFMLPFCIAKMMIKLSPILRRELQVLGSADKIINAPGGVNIGPYKDWRYIWRLYVSIKLKKDVAIYSISFGPIPQSFIFNRVSKYILRNVKFLSIRDNKSQKFAEDMNLKYMRSIDTAFIGYDDREKLPAEIALLIKHDYVVVVPNEVQNWGGRGRWHHNFMGCKHEDVDNLYVDMINYLLTLNKKVYLLPQLYGGQNDVEYLNYLKDKVSHMEVIVINENYNSNIQQIIVKNARFLVGARYHSIIFAINNRTPMLSLSYEHKMTNTLDILGLEKQNLDLPSILREKNIDVIKILKELYGKKCSCFDDEKSSDGCKIANTTMTKLHEFLLG